MTDIRSLILYLDKITFQEGTNLLAKRGPSRETNSEGGKGILSRQ